VDGRALVAAYRAVFGLLALAAIATQAISLSSLGIFNPGNFFSFFTILSNLIAAAVLLVAVARWRSERSRRLDLVRGGAVVYMAVTGIVYSLLLRGADVDTALVWVNVVVHYLMPVVMVADWLIDPPAERITYGQGLLWLSFPFVWTIYTLIRGAIVTWYPYPFLDPTNGGYATVALYSLAILVVMFAVCIGVVALGNARRGGTSRPLELEVQ
jgi:hypothetical protein